MKAILGYRDDKLPNDLEIWSSYVHQDDKKSVMDAFQAHIDEKTPEFVYEHRMWQKDGSIRWILARGTAIRDEQGNCIRVFGTDTDITRLKRTDEALRQARDKLEQRIKERTAELAQIYQRLKLEIKGRKGTEIELRASEERYRALAKAKFSQRMAGKKVYPYELVFYAKSGEKRVAGILGMKK